MTKIDLSQRFLTVASTAVLALLAALFCASAGLGATDRGGAAGSLTVVETAPISELNPVNLHIQFWPYTLQVFDTLTRENAKLVPQPRLAQSWQFNKQMTSLTVHLRSGVKFSDGSPLTAKDIVWNVVYQLSPAASANVAPLLKGIVYRVKAINSTTLLFRFTHPDPNIFDAFDLMFIVKPTSNTATLNSHPIGTGPYAISAFTPNVQVTLTKNPRYWGSSGIASQITIKTVPDQQSAAAALESGGADVFMSPSGAVVQSLKTQSGVAIQKVASAPLILSLEINTQKPGLSDPRVRQAISDAIDRQRVANLAYAGESAGWCLPWSASSAAFDQSGRTCTQDLTKAKQLIAQAGFANKLSLTINAVTTLPDTVVLAETLANSLNSIGVHATIQELSIDVALQDFSSGNYDLTGWTFGRANRSPATALGAAVVWDPYSGNQNAFWTGIQSPVYMRLRNEIEAGKATKQTYTKLNAFLLNDPFTITVAPNPSLIAIRSGVSGVRANVDGMLDLSATKTA